MAAATTRRPAPPLEHRILTTATLCLLAFGAVMVYSASSPIGPSSVGGASASFDASNPLTNDPPRPTSAVAVLTQLKSVIHS